MKFAVLLLAYLLTVATSPGQLGLTLAECEARYPVPDYKPGDNTDFPNPPAGFETRVFRSMSGPLKITVQLWNNKVCRLAVTGNIPEFTPDALAHAMKANADGSSWELSPEQTSIARVFISPWEGVSVYSREDKKAIAILKTYPSRSGPFGREIPAYQTLTIQQAGFIDIYNAARTGGRKPAPVPVTRTRY